MVSARVVKISKLMSLSFRKNFISASLASAYPVSLRFFKESVQSMVSSPSNNL